MPNVSRANDISAAANRNSAYLSEDASMPNRCELSEQRISSQGSEPPGLDGLLRSVNSTTAIPRALSAFGIEQPHPRALSKTRCESQCEDRENIHHRSASPW